MKVFKYTAVVWKETEGYVSKCSELGVASYGESFDQAVSNLREAVELYLENAKELDLIEDVEETWKKENPLSVLAVNLLSFHRGEKYSGPCILNQFVINYLPKAIVK